MFKKAVIILLFVIFGFNGIAQNFNPDFTDKMALSEQNSFKLKNAFKESADYASYDLVYQRMEWEINPNIKYISGVITSYFTSQKSGLTEIEFDLNSQMSVDSVLQQNEKISFVLNENKLVIELNQPLQNQELDSVQIYYQGIPEQEASGFGSFTKSEHKGVPIIWTLSEPYGAMEWWPCKQSLVDKIDSIDVIVTSPDSFRTASNGILVSEIVEDSIRTMHWKHRYPIATYLVAIAVTNYVDYSDTVKFADGREMDILNFVYPEYLERAKNESAVTPEVIELFNDLIGEYPFSKEKYGHAQFSWGGGMEHQTMSFMYNLSFDLLVHELAHQWFGDYITVGTWQDIWLNEGFATYMTALAYEHFFDGNYWPIWKTKTLQRIVSEPDGSVFVRDTTDISALFSSRLSYSKGAYLLHMLRWVLGDEHFFEAMRSYYNDPAIANGFARNKQFVEHMEMAGDTILTEFFNDWYYGEGFPVYSASYAPQGSGLKITLSQTTSHQSVEFFEMPVPVRVYNSGKTDSMDFRLNSISNNQEFFVETDFKVADLVIDPDHWIISQTSEIVKAIPNPPLNEAVIYPNPFTESFSVYIPSGQQLVSTKIYNAEGMLIKEFVGNNSIFDCTGISNGVYLIQFQTDLGMFEKKMVKQ